MRIEFVPEEVGTHIIEASIGGTKLAGGPLVAKVYDSSLIKVTDVNGGVVGQPCQFRGIHLLIEINSNSKFENSKQSYNYCGRSHTQLDIICILFCMF